MNAHQQSCRDLYKFSPKPFTSRLPKLLLKMNNVNAITTASIFEALHCLADAGIDAILVGGAAIRLHGGRGCKDVDVVVSSNDVMRAINLKKTSSVLELCDIKTDEGDITYDKLDFDTLKVQNHILRVTTTECLLLSKIRKYWTRDDATAVGLQHAEQDLLDVRWLAQHSHTEALLSLRSKTGLPALSSYHLQDIHDYMKTHELTHILILLGM